MAALPYTLNGIGTRYAGRKNVSVLVAVCPSCGRRAELSDYDTREWFCFVFIPLIPLRSFRIQSDCPSCRKHFRIPLREFRATLETTVRPHEEAFARAPGDPEAALRLAQARLDVRMFREAEDAIRRGLSASPKHVGLNRALGDLLAARGDHAAAEAPRRLVAGAEPRDAAARLALGRTLLLVGKHEEAVRELEEAARLDPASNGPRVLHAEALFAAGRYAEALQRYEELSMRDPALAADRQVLTRKKECKEKLGFPVSAAEKKAARKWWPFGRKPGARPVSAARETNWKFVGIAGGGIAFVVLAGTFLVANDQRSHPPLYLVNALPAPVTVTFDGEKIPLGPGPVLKRSIAPGRHRIVAAGKTGAVVDTVDADVPTQGWFDALFSPRSYVYNVASAALFRIQRVGYATAKADETYSEEILAFQHFFGRPNADYVFETPPKSISVSSHSQVEVRTALNVARDLDYDKLGAIRWNEGKKPEAEKCVRKAVELAPCDAHARRDLQTVLVSTGRAPEAVDAARAWIAVCPGDPIEPHRAYQDLLDAEGRSDEVRAEYGRRLEAAPRDAAAHYLYGRLLDTSEKRLVEYEIALALSPDLTRVRTARGIALLTLERYGEALPELEKTLGARDRDDRVFHVFADAAIGGKDADRAAHLLEAMRAKDPSNESLESACWTLMLARRQWDPAERVLKDQGRVPDRETEWIRRAQLMALKAPAADLAAFLDPAKTPKELARFAAFARFQQRMSQGAFREGVEGLDRDTASEPGGVYRLHQAAALYLAGDRAGGDARARAARADGNAPPWVKFLADVFLGTEKGEDALAKARAVDFHVLPHAYLVLGVNAARSGDPAAAKEHYARGESVCTDSEYPLLLFRRLSGR